MATLTEALWDALDGPVELLATVAPVTGAGSLPSYFRVTDLATASVTAAGLAIGELITELTGSAPMITVDRALVSGWFGSSFRPIGWEVPSPWDALAGDYATADGWIRLHTNAPHHRAAALRVLEVPASPDAVAAEVASWHSRALEAAIVAEGGCAAAMHSEAEWVVHPQGAAVAGEPLLEWDQTDSGAIGEAWRPSAARPLAGLRVLDLTRVIAGPVATRFLTGYGANVLRIDPPDWAEPALASEVNLGKRCARLDAKTPAGLAQLMGLIAKADVLVHGYRPGALRRLGLGSAARRKIRPGLIDVSLSAYGWSGPWADRRGFDSLVQMSSGIAARGMVWAGRERPTPLPVQALDHATGYLLAAAVIRGVTRAFSTRRGTFARTSLARIAAELVAAGGQSDTGPVTSPLPERAEQTFWGDGARLQPPLTVDGAPMGWDRSAAPLGVDEPVWS